jgi:1-acyl-sn-glycerol-3-phosphate acyltransferase
MRDREPLISLYVYRAFKWGVVYPALKTYFQGRIYDRENIPKKGAFILVSNHASNYDPPFIAAAMHRPIAYMAKAELFDVPVFGKAIELYGAYPVKRGTGDRAAIRSALNFVDNGWGVGLFLTGTRTPDGTVVDPKAGAALIAAKSQVPVIPVSIWGSLAIDSADSKLPPAVPITIRVGKPLPPPATTRREDLDAATANWADVINSLYAMGR